jgi:hypothetical protein
MRDYVRGLLAPVARKNSWQLAEHAGHTTPDGLQHLLSRAHWDADEVRDDLQTYVAGQLGREDGVLIIDDTGFVKKGTTSAGVQRQYSGTAGRTENCQIGVLAAYATPAGRAPVDRELYLPKSWTGDPDRCRAARVPAEREFATMGALAKAIVLRALTSPLPIACVAADAAYGQEGRFRRMLELAPQRGNPLRVVEQACCALSPVHPEVAGHGAGLRCGSGARAGRGRLSEFKIVCGVNPSVGSGAAVDSASAGRATLQFGYVFVDRVPADAEDLRVRGDGCSITSCRSGGRSPSGPAG